MNTVTYTWKEKNNRAELYRDGEVRVSTFRRHKGDFMLMGEVEDYIRRSHPQDLITFEHIPLFGVK